MKTLFPILLLCISTLCTAQIPDGEWHYYSRNFDGSRFSPLDQINQDNASQLKPAWTFRTGDMVDHGGHYFECTPLIIGDTMYVISMFSRLLAINPTTGKLKWEYNPDPPLAHSETGAGGLASRGVSYWKSGREERIFLPVRDGRLYSINPRTRKPDPNFGNNGLINLRDGLPEDGYFLFMSSPPAIYEDLVIQGFGINDSNRKASKVPLRAFDVRTGKEVWRFNTIPDEGDFGSDTWGDMSHKNRGGGNVWSIMSIDHERGMLFLPVSTPNWDFYGGDRPGNNLFTDSVVALDANTGERVWHYQTVHHDLWDYDLAAQPNLVDLTINGRTIPAVVQAGKTGLVYVLNRNTGKPLFPIEETPVPQDNQTNEQVSPTQPIPSKPPALTRQILTEDGLNNLDPETYPDILETFRSLRSEGIFTPPSLQGSVVYPGLHGGANWSGAAVSPDGMMYINTTELAFIIRLEEFEGSPFGYRIKGNIFWRDKNGYPSVAPPWGELVKVDLNEGEIKWRVPLGEFPELTAKGIPITGTENFGGATVTAGGIVFIASTMDEKIRAFSTTDGSELWEGELSAAGYAAPVTYTGSDGRQYVAICAGGGCKPGTPHGDYIQAFTLPQSK